MVRKCLTANVTKRLRGHRGGGAFHLSRLAKETITRHQSGPLIAMSISRLPVPLFPDLAAPENPKLNAYCMGYYRRSLGQLTAIPCPIGSVGQTWPYFPIPRGTWDWASFFVSIMKVSWKLELLHWVSGQRRGLVTATSVAWVFGTDPSRTFDRHRNMLRDTRQGSRSCMLLQVGGRWVAIGIRRFPPPLLLGALCSVPSSIPLYY